VKDIKALIIVAIVTGIIYWGVEPLAHGVMHPHVEPAEYTFKDTPKLPAGNAENGATLVQSNCIACHSIKAQGFDAPMSELDSANSYGVVPPDLSNVGAIFDEGFLAGFIKDPVKATKLSHKFNDAKPYPMPGYGWMSDNDVADMVAYLKTIAKKDMSDKEVFVDACSRCHTLKYDKIAATTPKDIVTKYMGSTPPDLSMMIRSRGDEYLHTFINDPQKLLHGTAMPRVGLTEKAEKQVVDYMESIGDSKKAERDALGMKVIIFTIIMTVFAYLWKVKIWRDVH